MMSYDEEKKCPLCAEEMDWTDQQLNPCKCGYEVCVWCWHHIMDMAEKEATEGRCPACRTPYDKDRVVGLETNFQRVASISSSRKQKVTKAKPKQNEGRKDLSNVRVIQRRMAYIIGLPVEYAYEELLERKEYFGQYGKVTKVSLSRTAGGTLQQFTNDTCSVYVTFSKEEEAVRCIQSVHGYDLDGRLLRASFGTAKYCHAWLRNTSCNNPACLYLHTMGADEDSFGKDEVAAVHTRNRVQEIVGATKYPPRRCGNMLPPPIVEQSNSYSTSADDPVRNDGRKSVASGDHLPCSKDKDAAVRSSKESTTFKDIVGRSSNSVEEERMLNLSHDDHLDTESSVSVLSKNSEISDDQKSKDSAESSHASSFSSAESKDPAEPSHTASFISAQSKVPADTTKDYSYNSWWHTDYHNQSSYVDKEDNVQAAFVNSELNDGYNEKKFQSLAKSDRIYRGSNSFSNEEIVEHLRRLDNDTPVDDDDESSAAIENTIISNILSMDLDGDSSVYPQTVTGLLETRDGRQGSSWNVQNNEHSRFSFAKEHGFSSQKFDMVSPSSNIGQGLNFSAVQDPFDNKDDRYKSQHQASRAQNLTPPGFSMLSKPPPGFSACMRTDQAVAPGSGSYYNVAPNTHYRSPSGNLSNSSDDYSDPAATMVGGKSSTSGLTNSWPSSFSSRCSTSSHGDAKNWFSMQQQSVPATTLPHLPQETLFSQTGVQQHHTPQFPSSGLVDGHHQSYNTSLFAQQPKFTNGYQQHNQLQEAPRRNARSEVGKFAYESFLPGYGDYMFQMPTSGDVYTPRVFGM
ncbi:putative zinc finger, RING/FYVE/PHD-type containing protein [Tanacetum coccineum]